MAGAVVDSLGLMLQSYDPEFSTGRLSQVHVDPRATGDSVQLVFRASDVTARRADRTATAPYGQVMNLGVVQFAVTSRPAVETTTLHIAAREPVIDGLLGGLVVTRRTDTDVIDIQYTAGDPATAQRIVNATVQAFQSINVKWARERSRRRREFLAEQVAQTDSMLARAQAELANFRSRQELASSADKLKARAGHPAPARDPHGRARCRPADVQRLAAAAEVQRRGHPHAGDPCAGHRPGHGRQRRDRRRSTISCSSTRTGSTR